MSSYLKNVHQSEAEDLYAPSPCISPPRSSRKTSPSSTPPRPSRKTNHTKNNPYATRGLDKFTALKAELEQKKQRIYSQDSSQNISLVRFAYSKSSDNAIPIVIKTTKDQNESTRHASSNLSKQDSFAFDNKYPVAESSSSSSSSRVKEIREAEKKKTGWENRLGYFNDPTYYVPVVLIFILVLLTFLGRSSAVLFTSLGWYSLPSLMGDSLRKKRSRKKKQMQDHSEKKKKTMVITGSDVTIPNETLHAHRKSW